MIKKLEEEGIEEELKELILTKMVCFGPTASCGTNFLISQFVKPGQSFLEKACLGKLETEDFDWSALTCKNNDWMRASFVCDGNA